MASWAQHRPSEAVEGYERPGERLFDPKPQKRLRATQEGWQKIRQQFPDATCVHCGLAGQSLHHAVSKARGGADLVENMVPLCGDGTRGCHGLIESHGPGWERVANSIRQYICSRSDRWAYVVGELGQDLFDRTYPSLNKRCAAQDCLLVAGHSGPHLDLAAEEFRPRHRDDYFEPLEWEEKI